MLRLAVILLACLGWACAAQAQNASAGTDEVQVRLLADFTQVRPGQRLRVALQQRIAPHWHTYWLNPGDSGQATAIEWALPAGATAGPILWPAPRSIPVGPLVNYGYGGEVLLLSDIQLPAALPAGQRVTLAASVNWLVCKDICIPQQAELALELPVAAQAIPSAEAPQLADAAKALPTPAPWPLQARREGQALVLHWPAEGSDRPAEFFAGAWGTIQHAAKPQLQRQGGRWEMRMPLGEAPPKPGEVLEGVLAVGDGPQRVAYQVSAKMGAAPLPTAEPGQDLALLGALGLALLGGLVLNLMPCVFPVLAIKAFSLVQQSHAQPAEARRLGVAYTAGVLASFAVLAGLLIALKAAGEQVGWGFQFQSPLFVLAVAYLLFALGLNLSGLLQVGGALGNVGAGLAEKPGYAGSFFTGVLATIVATPCTAPFMGAALVYALAQPALELLAVFLSLGLGLALPYLLLSSWPGLQRWLPRPGAWMEVLKQGLAFPLYGAAIWLVWVLAQQRGPQGVLVALSGMGLIALAAWLRQVSRQARPLPRRGGTLAAAGALAAALGLGLVLPAETPANETVQADHEPYSPERLAALRAEGRPVFVNLTAAWCISCLVNERVALSQPEVREAFATGGVSYLKGDWTRRDERITALLAEHGRNGVPLYLFFPAGGTRPAVVLPQLLTPGIVKEALAAPVLSTLSNPSPPS